MDAYLFVVYAQDEAVCTIHILCLLTLKLWLLTSHFNECIHMINGKKKTIKDISIRFIMSKLITCT